jgi:hypothetical protein
VFLFQTQCTSRELYRYILSELGVGLSGMDLVAMHEKLNEILARERLAGRRFVLAIDEAQNLDPSVLETIRLLSNYETSRAKLLQILLIGQPQLARKLVDPELAQMEQRVAVFARLQPFNPEESGRYISHRLQVAGYGGGPLFTPPALQIIADRSKGIPRNINRLCFSALSLGRAMGRKRIDAEIVREVVADLDVERLRKPLPAHSVMHAPVTAGPVISYRAKSKSRFQGGALGAATVAASIAAAGAFLIYSPVRVNRFWRPKPEASSATFNSSSGKENSSEASEVPKSIASSSANVAEISAVTSSQPALPDSDSGTIRVSVQPGETLRMIALRILGKNGEEVIEQIQKLNPAVSDPDNLRAGQEISLPRLSKASNSPQAGGPTDMSAKELGPRVPND